MYIYIYIYISTVFAWLLGLETACHHVTSIDDRLDVVIGQSCS